ncbi:MAG: Hint domain-containing protein [Chloroflexi bacterium]|nr:Hint domain-containing protein [Chloroflexota bacterium]
MSTGGRKNIEDVKIGDSVQGINDRGGKTVGTVTATQQPISNNLCTIKYTNGEDLQVTNSHPLYTQNGWKAIDPAAAALEDPGVPVTKLLVGDLMKNVNGTWPQIAGISCQTGTFQTYNFTVDNTHDYFAGGFLAHNKGGQRCNSITATKYTLGGQPVALYWTNTKTGDTTDYVTQYSNPAVWQDSGCSGANCQYGDVVMWAGNYTMTTSVPSGYNVSFLRLH